jgi:hypothetical protein
MSDIAQVLDWADRMAGLVEKQSAQPRTYLQKKENDLQALLVQIHALLDQAEKQAAELKIKPQLLEAEQEAEQALTDHAQKFGLPVVFEELFIDQVSYPRRRN